MNPLAPLSKVFEWSDPAVVAAALLLGIGFGFVLERAGFGNSRVLAGQWYGYNFAVLRVMFTAIVVSMLGLFGLASVGVVDLDLVYINETFLWPQVVGGLIFGVGFVVGQYCPGTALVGCATGKFDAMAFVGGFFLGLVGFFFAFPLFEGFYGSSSMGRSLLPGLLHLPPGVVALMVVVMALGAFAVTHVVEKRLGKSSAPIVTRPRVIFSLATLAVGILVAGISASGEPKRQLKFEVSDTVATVTPAELADWGLEGRRDYVVIDLRPADDFERGHIKDSVSCGTCHHDKQEAAKDAQGERFVDLTKKLVVYTQTGKESVALPRLLAKNPRLVQLAGGYDAWESQVMTRVAFGGERDAAELLAKQKREAARAYYSGERPSVGGEAKLPLAPLKRDTAHAPAKAVEGC